MKQQQVKKQKIQIPKSVIEFYSKYRTKIKIKPQLIQGSLFEISDQYEVIDSGNTNKFFYQIQVGHGAYGAVVAAVDKKNKDKNNNLIAIKKIEKAFEHKIFAKRTLRELKILRLLNHENVVDVITLLLPNSREDFEDIYVVNQLMETDLASIIKSPQPLSDEHCQFFLYQILRGMKYVHSANILHRDLKPRNLLVNSNCDLKICDFGLARTMQNITNKVSNMTDYVATRWYRAPELLLAQKSYSTSVDVWSIGCIFAELLKRRPLWQGTDTKNQIELIFDTIGTPSDEDIQKIQREKSKYFVKGLAKRKGVNFEQLFPKAAPEALDLLRKMLIFDSDKRITLDEALEHPYLSALHCDEDEPTTEPVNSIDFEFENQSFTLQQIKDMIYEEILLYHYPEFYKEYQQKKQKNISLISHILKNDNSQILDADDSDEYDSDSDDFF